MLAALGGSEQGSRIGRGDPAGLSMGRGGLVGSRWRARVALMPGRKLYLIACIGSREERAKVSRGCSVTGNA